MDETQQLELGIRDESKQGVGAPNQRLSLPEKMNVSRWIRVCVYTILLLVGQSVATLLGRLYFDKGGKSKWLEALVTLIGFPVLIPLYFLLPITKTSTHYANNYNNPPSFAKISSIYMGLGLLVAANTMLYTYGLQYLPVSTFTLVCASQLAFNAVFSFFLNGQSFSPYILNSLVLLTISSILLAFQKFDESTNSVSQGMKYALGFIFTLIASAGYALLLLVSQLVFQKILRGRTFKLILDMIIYESITSSIVIVVGLFVSGEWKTIKGEMEVYELGKVSYVMNLVWTACLWQAYGVGATGLLFEVSSLFSNVISTMGLPISPVLGVIFLKDNMNGIKGIAMALALWGFVSYTYQHYLEEFKSYNSGALDNVHVASSNDENS